MKEYSEEDLVRYVTNDLEAAERTQLEDALRQDAALRDQLSTLLSVRGDAQAWFASPAPGGKRVESLSVPRVVMAKPTVRAGRRANMYAGRIAAAALIFTAGYLAGHSRQDPSAGQTPDQAVVSIPTPAPAVVPAVGTTPTTGADVPSQGESTGSDGVQQASLNQEPPIVTEEKDGRVIVQTTLRASGTRATWIVDGEFQLAQSAAATR